MFGELLECLVFSHQFAVCLIYRSAHLLVLASFSDFPVAITDYFAQTTVRGEYFIEFSRLPLELIKTVAPGPNPIYCYTKYLKLTGSRTWSVYLHELMYLNRLVLSILLVFSELTWTAF